MFYLVLEHWTELWAIARCSDALKRVFAGHTTRMIIRFYLREESIAHLHTSIVNHIICNTK